MNEFNFDDVEITLVVYNYHNLDTLVSKDGPIDVVYLHGQSAMVPWFRQGKKMVNAATVSEFQFVEKSDE